MTSSTNHFVGINTDLHDGEIVTFGTKVFSIAHSHAPARECNAFINIIGYHAGAWESVVAVFTQSLIVYQQSTNLSLCSIFALGQAFKA